MLDKLFCSNSRVKLLKLFFLHPSERFYIREIARHLDLQLNSVFRELNNLEEIGLLLAEAGPESEEELPIEQIEPDAITKKKAPKDKEIKKQERKYYKVNPDFIFFNEIKALIVKSQMLYEKDFTDSLKKVGDIKLLVLTGIFVNSFDSPVDLLLVGDCNKKKLLKVIDDLEGELVKEINYAVMTEDEFTYRREITDMFLYNILEGEKLVVIDLNNVVS